MICKIFVNLCSFLIHSFVEWVARSFEAFVKVKPVHIRNKASLDNLSNFSHFAKFVIF